jgi:hypothetical protein
MQFPALVKLVGRSAMRMCLTGVASKFLIPLLLTNLPIAAVVSIFDAVFQGDAEFGVVRSFVALFGLLARRLTTGKATFESGDQLQLPMELLGLATKRSIIARLEGEVKRQTELLPLAKLQRHLHKEQTKSAVAWASSSNSAHMALLIKNCPMMSPRELRRLLREFETHCISGGGRNADEERKAQRAQERRTVSAPPGEKKFFLTGSSGGLCPRVFARLLDATSRLLFLHTFQYDAQCARALFAFYDTTGAGVIDVRGYVLYLSTLIRGSAEKRIEECFHAYDDERLGLLGRAAIERLTAGLLNTIVAQRQTHFPHGTTGGSASKLAESKAQVELDEIRVSLPSSSSSSSSSSSRASAASRHAAMLRCCTVALGSLTSVEPDHLFPLIERKMQAMEHKHKRGGTQHNHVSFHEFRRHVMRDPLLLSCFALPHSIRLPEQQQQQQQQQARAAASMPASPSTPKHSKPKSPRSARYDAGSGGNGGTPNSSPIQLKGSSGSDLIDDHLFDMIKVMREAAGNGAATGFAPRQSFDEWKRLASTSCKCCTIC